MKKLGLLIGKWLGINQIREFKIYPYKPTNNGKFKRLNRLR